MKKTLIIRISVILCAVLAVCTFFSKTVYGLSLPTIHTEKVKSGLVTRSAKAEGKIVCKDAVEVKAGNGWRIDEVFVGNGESVEAGDLLFTIETADLELNGMSLELEVLRLKNNLEALDDANNAKTAAITAPFDGFVTDAPRVKVGQKLDKGAPLGRFVDDSAFLVTVYFLETYRAAVKTGMTVSVALSDWMYMADGVVEKI